jgi:adenylate cyclase
MAVTEGAESTGRSSDRRKLVAVLYADMVGYSRLIGLDDVGTLERLRMLRREVLDLAIEQHSGRIIQTGGDSLLIVFDSIDGAVRCAVTVQQQIPAHDGDQPLDRAIRFRIGINIGDAIADGTDLHGDAVNIAARLQACPPGGICVSRSARDQVHGRLDLGFEVRGLLNLKDIARPVEAFVLRPDAAATTKSVERSLLGGAGEALPLPDKPSIAVLAFTNMSGDPEQEYFSDGIAEDIITELSRSRSQFVIARNSSFTYRGRAVDIKQVARELGVRYVLEGSVRREAIRVRINAQLIDAETGNHIWAERYDREIEHMFAVQDEIAEAVAAAIRPAVGDAEQRRVLRKPPDSLSAWETYQRGLWHEAKHNAADNALARQLFQQAIRLDSTFAPAYAELAQTYLVDCIYETRSRKEASALAMEQAEAALRIDPENAEANTAMGVARSYIGDTEGAAICYDQALSIDPTNARARRYKASNLLFSGHPAQAREVFLAHLRINPRDVTAATNRVQIALSHYLERDYEAAADVARRAIAAYPYHPHSYRLLVASLGQLGQEKGAAAARAKADEISPHPIKHYVSEGPPWMRHEDYHHVLDGLRKGGWQG